MSIASHPVVSHTAAGASAQFAFKPLTPQQAANQRRWQRSKRLRCVGGQQSGPGSSPFPRPRGSSSSPNSHSSSGPGITGALSNIATSSSSSSSSSGADKPSSNSSSSSQNRPGSTGSSNNTAVASPTRRSLLAAATAGGLYAWAGRSLASADASADAAVAAGASGGAGLDLLRRQLDQRLSTFSLPNGLRFLVYERHSAPIASFHIYADVGAFDEEDGQTGATAGPHTGGCACRLRTITAAVRQPGWRAHAGSEGCSAVPTIEVNLRLYCPALLLAGPLQAWPTCWSTWHSRAPPESEPATTGTQRGLASFPATADCVTPCTAWLSGPWSQPVVALHRPCALLGVLHHLHLRGHVCEAPCNARSQLFAAAAR